MPEENQFFCGHESGSVAYFQISKTLLGCSSKLGISLDEVFLYAILRDRAKLSFQNGKIDEDGHIYIYYTRESAAKYLRWSLRKTGNVFQALVQHGLLAEVTCSRQRAKRLYVKLWSETSSEDINSYNFPYLTAFNINKGVGNYYILPKVLLEEEQYRGLSLRAVLLYVIALDRLMLSLCFGRLDNNGIPWTTLNADITQSELHCSQHTLSRTYKELEEIGLLVRKRAAVSHQWHIYARHYLTLTAEPEVPNLPVCVANPAVQTCQFCPSELPNLHTNNNPYNNHFNNISTHQDILRENNAYEEACNLIHYDDTLALIYNELHSESLSIAEEALNICISTIQQDLLSTDLFITIGHNSVERSSVLNQYRRLNPFILYTMISKTVENYHKVKNLSAYIHKALYSAAEQHASAAYYFERNFYEQEYSK